MKHLFVILGLAGLLFLSGSCHQATSSSSSTPAYESYLYMTDTYSGGVYYYNPSTQTASTQSIVSTAQDSTGEIQFYKGKGYISVGSYGNTKPGVYWFDPSASVPATQQIGSNVSAQYIAFYSTTKAYVTVADYSSPSGNGLYTFNPSNVSAGLTTVSSTIDSSSYPQEVILGADNMIYFTDNYQKKVVELDPETDTISQSFTTSSASPTGLYAGTYGGSKGIFVANISGSIDFIVSGSSTIKNVITTSSSSPIYPGRIVQLSTGNLVATGYDTSYANHTYFVSLSGTTATVKELLDSSNASFGSLDIAYKNNLIYIPVGDYSYTNNRLFVLDETGIQKSYSPVSVMNSGSLTLTNIGFYQN